MPRVLFPGLLLVLGSCNTHFETTLVSGSISAVCQDTAYCRSFGDPWIEACRNQAAELRTEADSSGCTGVFDNYYACAAAQYDCTGNVPTFEGCQDALSALQVCLSAGQAQNACGRLQAALSACGVADGGAAQLPPPCVGGSVCVARCYLDNVTGLCAPRPIDLVAVTQCAQMCPF